MQIAKRKQTLISTDSTLCNFSYRPFEDIVVFLIGLDQGHMMAIRVFMHFDPKYMYFLFPNSSNIHQ